MKQFECVKQEGEITDIASGRSRAFLNENEGKETENRMKSKSTGKSPNKASWNQWEKSAFELESGRWKKAKRI
ncbi:MAG: hypothetical protein ACLVB1_03480 [Blautia obeum]